MADDVIAIDPIGIDPIGVDPKDPTVKVILDIDTDVLLRTTVDAVPSYNPDTEKILEIKLSEHPFKDADQPLIGKFVRYDEKSATFVEASAQEAVDAGVDQDAVAAKFEVLRKQLVGKRQAIIDNGNIPFEIRDYFDTQRQIETLRGL